MNALDYGGVGKLSRRDILKSVSIGGIISVNTGITSASESDKNLSVVNCVLNPGPHGHHGPISVEIDGESITPDFGDSSGPVAVSSGLQEVSVIGGSGSVRNASEYLLSAEVTVPGKNSILLVHGDARNKVDITLVTSPREGDQGSSEVNVVNGCSTGDSITMRSRAGRGRNLSNALSFGESSSFKNVPALETGVEVVGVNDPLTQNFSLPPDSGNGRTLVTIGSAQDAGEMFGIIQVNH